MKRFGHWAMVVLFAVSGLVSAAPAQPSQGDKAGASGKESRKVVVAIPRKTFGYLPLYVGLNKGFFAEKGLTLDIREIQPNQQVPGLLSGEIDVAGVGSSVMRAAAQGADVRAIVFSYDKSNFQLVARPGIKSVPELKGKVIGVSTIGSSTHMAAVTVAKHFGLGPDKDVKFVAVGAGSQGFAAVKSGAVDASMLNVDEAAILNAAGFPTIFSTGDIMDTPFSGFGTSLKAMKEKRDLIKDWVSAYVRSLIYTRDNVADVIQIAIREFKMDAKIADIAVKATVPSVASGTPGGTSPGGLRKLIAQDVMAPAKITTPIPPEKLVDFSILEEVKKEFAR